MAQNKFNSAKLAKDIIAKRTKEGLTQRGVAEATKQRITQSTLYRLEVPNSHIPSAVVLADICNWLGVPVQNYFS